MVSLNRVRVIALRSFGLKFSLITLVLAVLALPVRAHAACTTSGNVTTCTSSAGITVSGTYAASEGSSNVVSGLSSVTNISLTFTNLNVTNLNDVAIVLVPPSGTPLDLLSGVCGYGTAQIGNSTFTLADTGDSGSDNNSGMLSGIGIGTCPGTFSGTYLPTDYFPGADTFNSPGPSSYNSGGADPSVNGSGTFNFSSFGESGSLLNGTWTLYIANQNAPGSGYANPSGTLGSWSLAFTGSSSIATTTSISANPNGMTLTSPVYTNSNVDGQATTGTSVTLTATVSPNPGGGTVTFYDSTNSSPGAGTVLASNVALSSGQAQTAVTFTGAEEGGRSISAVYSGTTGYLGSSTPANSEVTVLTVNHPYNPSSGTYCNGPVKANDNPSNVGGTGGFPYPSQLILSGISGTIEEVTVTLNGLQVQDPNFTGFMLQAPNGTGYEFMSFADGNGPGGSPAGLTNTTVYLADGGSGLLQTSSQNTDTPQTCSSGSPCKPADDYVQIDPLYNDTFPSPGSPFTAATSVGKAYPTGSATFTSQFGGAGANGTWLLYLNNWLSENPSNNSSLPYGEVASWCLNLTMQAGAHATTTALTASPNPVTISSGTTATVNLTATVTVTDGTLFSDDSNPGSVTFVDGSTTLGTANVSDSGVATLTGATLAEGTHQIVASYSGTSSGTEFGISSATLDLRVNKATTIPTSGSGAGPYAFCNTGSIVAPATGYDYGAALPYPSNVFVSNLPGTVKATTVTLNDFTTRDQGDLMSLLVGPGGNNLEFFSLTGSNVGTAPPPFNLVLADGASRITGNLGSSGTYEPTSFNTSITYPQCAQNAPLCGSENVGPPLGTLSAFTPTNKAASAGTGLLGGSSEAGVFGGTTASTYLGNGTWSLYIDDGGTTGEGEDTSISGGWCVNLTVNLPTISFSGPAPSTFTQGGTGSLAAVTITNNGIDGNGEAGSIGDPTQTTANAMTVVDTLPAGLTYSSVTGTDWACSAPGGGPTVTCTNEDAVAVGASYSALTINVSVSNTASGAIGNNTVSVSDAVAANTPSSQSDSVTIDVPPAFTSGNSTTFTVGSSGAFTVTASGYPAPTFSETGSLPSGVTFTGAGVLSGTPAAGTGGTYPIIITAANGTTNATQDFMLTVNQAPAITSAGSAAFAVGTASSFTVTTTGYPTVTFSESGALPSGVTLTTAGVLAGTPAANSGGVYTFTITASNTASPNATQNFTLTVNQAPAITSANNTTFVAGTAGTFTVTTTGYPKSALSESGTSLPSGITFTDNGNGTATISATSAISTSGVYSFTITANNGITNATQAFTLTVKPVLAALTSPTPGISTVLGAANVAFQWTTGVGVTEYQLNLGTTSPGASDLYSYKGTATSTMVPTLPSNGVTVYATLYSKINGAWQSNAYFYTESGTPVPAILQSPTPGLGTVLGTSDVPFQWSAGTGVNLYQLNLSAIAPGDSELFSYKGTAMTVTAPSLPANGIILYARLYSYIDKTWQYNDFVYTESGTPLAVLQSPTPGLTSVLGTSSVPFQWSGGTGVTLYQLNVSAIAPGQSELFSYKGTATSATATSLPANGVTLYARLYSYIDKAWRYIDYVYTESGTTAPAILTFPSPGLSTVLGTSNVGFQWSQGTGVKLYQLNLSAIAPGDSELFLYKGSATTATAPTLPANGVKVYSRLYSNIDGVWVYNDYVYTEQ